MIFARACFRDWELAVAREIWSLAFECPPALKVSCCVFPPKYYLPFLIYSLELFFFILLKFSKLIIISWIVFTVNASKYENVCAGHLAVPPPSMLLRDCFNLLLSSCLTTFLFKTGVIVDKYYRKVSQQHLSLFKLICIAQDIILMNLSFKVL